MFYFLHSNYYYSFLMYSLIFCLALPLKCKLHESRHLVLSFVHCCTVSTYDSAWHIVDTQELFVKQMRGRMTMDYMSSVALSRGPAAPLV